MPLPMHPARGLITVAAIVLTVSACSKTSEAPPERPLVNLPLEISVGSGAEVIDNSDAGIESCAKAALAKVPGELLRASLQSRTEGRYWEFEVRRDDGRRALLDCSDRAGTVADAGFMVATARDPAFAKAASVDEATARQRALTARPGDIEQIHYQLMPDGKARYRLQIRSGQDLHQVWVDAADAEVIGRERELLRIGAP